MLDGSRCNSSIFLDDSRHPVYLQVPNVAAVDDPDRGAQGGSLPQQQNSFSGQQPDQVAPPTASAPDSSASATPFSPGCPTNFYTRPGQRVAVTLFNFRGSHVAASSSSGVQPPAAAMSSSSSASAAEAPSCEVGPLVVLELTTGRRRVQGLCDPRQHREQLLLTSNSSAIGLHFAATTGGGRGLQPQGKQQQSPDQHHQQQQQQHSTAETTTTWQLRTSYVIKLEGQ